MITPLHLELFQFRSPCLCDSAAVLFSVANAPREKHSGKNRRTRRLLPATEMARFVLTGKKALRHKIKRGLLLNEER